MESSAMVSYEGRELEICFEYERTIPETLDHPVEAYFNVLSIKYMGKLKKDGTYEEKYEPIYGREITNLLSRDTTDILSEKVIRENGYLF